MNTMKIVGLGLCMVMAFACKKDEALSNCDRLEGNWLCTSWMEDNIEFLGAEEFITSAEIEFKTLAGNQGDYDQHITYMIGGSEMIIGAYVVNAACTEVTITPKAGLPATYDFEFESDTLTLSGLINAVDFELKFIKE